MPRYRACTINFSLAVLVLICCTCSFLQKRTNDHQGNGVVSLNASSHLKNRSKLPELEPKNDTSKVSLGYRWQSGAAFGCCVKLKLS